MRAHILKARPATGRSKATLHIAEPLAILANDETEFRSPLASPAKVPEQPSRDWNARAALVGAPNARRIEVNAASIQVHLGPTQRQDSFLAGAAIQPEKDEQGQMKPHTRFAQSGSQESRRFLSCQPAIPRLRPIRHVNGDHTS
jgi:hypothetical protein